MVTLTTSPMQGIDAERRRAIRWMCAEIADAAQAIGRRAESGVEETVARVLGRVS